MAPDDDGWIIAVQGSALPRAGFAPTIGAAGIQWKTRHRGRRRQLHDARIPDVMAAGHSQPTVSTLNALDAAVTSNLAIVPATGGSISAFPSNPAHLILDVFGYFAP